MLKKCVFPVGGYGTRFLPATKSMPKEMMPIVNKPLVQYGVEEAMHAGMKDICLVTGRGKRAIADHFDISYELEHQIQGTGKERYLTSIRQVQDECVFSSIRQREVKGLGHAILTSEPAVGNQAFGVILSDDLCFTEGPGVLEQMVSIYEKYQCSVVAIEEVPEEDTEKYGVIKGEEIESGVFRVSEMVEKPKPEEAPSRFAIIGRYILTPDIFDILKTTAPGKGGEIQITDALEQQAQQGKVIAYRFQGKRFDCGSVDGFVEATNHFYNTIYKK